MAEAIVLSLASWLVGDWLFLRFAKRRAIFRACLSHAIATLAALCCLLFIPERFFSFLASDHFSFASVAGSDVVNRELNIANLGIVVVLMFMNVFVFLVSQVLFAKLQTVAKRRPNIMGSLSRRVRNVIVVLLSVGIFLVVKVLIVFLVPTVTLRESYVPGFGLLFVDDLIGAIVGLFGVLLLARAFLFGSLSVQGSCLWYYTNFTAAAVVGFAFFSSAWLWVFNEHWLGPGWVRFLSVLSVVFAILLLFQCFFGRRERNESNTSVTGWGYWVGRLRTVLVKGQDGTLAALSFLSPLLFLLAYGVVADVLCSSVNRFFSSRVAVVLYRDLNREVVRSGLTGSGPLVEVPGKQRGCLLVKPAASGSLDALEVGPSVGGLSGGGREIPSEGEIRLQTRVSRANLWFPGMGDVFEEEVLASVDGLRWWFFLWSADGLLFSGFPKGSVDVCEVYHKAHGLLGAFLGCGYGIWASNGLAVTAHWREGGSVLQACCIFGESSGRTRAFSKAWWEPWELGASWLLFPLGAFVVDIHATEELYLLRLARLRLLPPVWFLLSGDGKLEFGAVGFRRVWFVP
ncbi:MAG: hypothetical protein ACP5PX_07830 [Candidatus Hadarchaeum sp.]|uniref:hypothetical protein n=1 Tax=Candidatus Hadarchaeum sp. TaxID=2883567 RepID=UPI003D144797